MLVIWSILLVKVYVLVTVVTEAATAPVAFIAAVKETVPEGMPARLVANV